MSRLYPLFRYKKCWSAGAGMLTGLGFPFPWLWPLALLGIALIVHLCITAASVRVAFVYGLLCGFILHIFALASIALGVFPFDWYGIENATMQILLVTVSWLAPAMVMGVALGLFALLARKWATDTWYDLLFLPSLWVVCEWLSSWFFYLLQLGPGSFFGPHFTLGYVGYLIAHDSVLLQMAYIGGVYGLSFLFVFLAVLLLKCIAAQERQQKAYRLLLLSVCFSWLSLHALFFLLQDQVPQEKTNTISAAVVSRYMPPALVQDTQFQKERYEELLALVVPLHDVDLLVFPESSTFLRHVLDQDDPSDLQAVQRIAKTGQSLMIIDSQDVMNESGNLSSVAGYFNTSKGITETRKQFLLPLGEYVPYLYQFFTRSFGGEKMLDTVLAARGYVPGMETSLGLVNGVSIAVRFCDEVMSPELFRKQVREGAEVLVDVSSLSWFHGSPAVFAQMQRVAKVRAVESSRWFVQSGNMAPAFVLDHMGRVVGQTQWGDREVLQSAIVPRINTTPYVLLGQWTLLIFFALAGGGIWKRSNQKSLKNV